MPQHNADSRFSKSTVKVSVNGGVIADGVVKLLIETSVFQSIGGHFWTDYEQRQKIISMKRMAYFSCLIPVLNLSMKVRFVFMYCYLN